jgi:hypothetical protein
MQVFKSLPLVLSLVLAASACGSEPSASPSEAQPSQDEPPRAVQADPEPETEASPKPKPEPEPATSGAAETNYVEIVAAHDPPKPSDPAIMRIPGVKVVSADFDPKKLDGATAQFELDMGSLISKVPDRDDHLKSDDFLDVPKFPVATVSISEVKKTETFYLAQAIVEARGAKVEWELPFEVLDVSDDSIRIRGKYSFSRMAFTIGEADGPADKVDASWDITLRKEP